MLYGKMASSIISMNIVHPHDQRRRFLRDEPSKDNLKLHPYKDPVECRRGNYWEKGMHINDVEPA